MAEWQPIETAPRNKKILLYVRHVDHKDEVHKKGYVVIQALLPETYTSHGRLYMGDLACCFGCPTHWMPIPKPPHD